MANLSTTVPEVNHLRHQSLSGDQSSSAEESRNDSVTTMATTTTTNPSTTSTSSTTTRLLLSLQMQTYKKTLITFLVIQIILTFFISAKSMQDTSSGGNFRVAQPYEPFGGSIVINHQAPHNDSRHIYSITTTTTTTTETPSSSVPSDDPQIAFLMQLVRLCNIPVNVIGVILVSVESLYCSLLYLLARYLYLYCLFRCTQTAAIYSCPLTVELILLVVLHMFCFKLYDDQYVWGNHNNGRWRRDSDQHSIISSSDGDDDDSYIDHRRGIFFIDNHLHHRQQQQQQQRQQRMRNMQPPPSYSEVTANPGQYPTLSVVLEVEETETTTTTTVAPPPTINELSVGNNNPNNPFNGSCSTANSNNNNNNNNNTNSTKKISLNNINNNSSNNNNNNANINHN